MFIVQADVKFEAVTPKDALETAVDLLVQGMTNVMIVDETGSAVRPAEFANLYVGDL